MDVEVKQNENAKFLKRYDTVFSFLGLEAVALLFFSFGGSMGSLILKIIGAFLAFLAFPFAEKAFDKTQLKRILLSLLPFLVFAVLLGFSAFWMAYYAEGVFYGILFGLLQGIGIIGLFALGFVLKTIPSLKKETVVFAVLVGLAAYVLITGVYSLSRYGGFYASIYAGQYYYFDGVIFPIAGETKGLIGFSFQEVSMSFGKAPAFLLASSGAGMLFFAKEKKTWKHYLTFVGLPLIGVLDLALVPYRRALLLLLALYVFALVARGIYEATRKHEKAAKIITRTAYFGLMSVVAIGVIFLFVDAANGMLIRAGIPYLSRSLSSPTSFFGEIRLSIQSVLYGSPANADLGKIDFVSLLFGASNLQSVTLSEVASFNLLYQNGLPMFLLMLFLAFAALAGYRSYLVRGGMNDMKGMLVMMMLGAFLYWNLAAESFPLVHGIEFMPTSSSPLLLGLAFVAGYAFDLEDFTFRKGAAHEE